MSSTTSESKTAKSLSKATRSKKKVAPVNPDKELLTFFLEKFKKINEVYIHPLRYVNKQGVIVAEIYYFMRHNEIKVSVKVEKDKLLSDLNKDSNNIRIKLIPIHNLEILCSEKNEMTIETVAEFIQKVFEEIDTILICKGCFCNINTKTVYNGLCIECKLLDRFSKLLSVCPICQSDSGGVSYVCKECFKCESKTLYHRSCMYKYLESTPKSECPLRHKLDRSNGCQCQDCCDENDDSDY